MTNATRNKVSLDDVLGLLKGVHKTSRGFMAFCPAHDDGRSHGYKAGQSLEIWEREGAAKLKCYAGCKIPDILSALHISQDDITPSASQVRKTKRLIACTYDYTDDAGCLLFQVVRFKPKGFAQRQPDGKGYWIWNLKGITPVPYRMPELKATISAGQTVYIVEGEKDADTARLMGLTATTSPMGAGRWCKNYTQTLQGATMVVVIPDKDEVGRAHAADIASSLHTQGTPVKILELPGPDKGFDFSDWHAGGGQPSELEDLIAKTPEYVPAGAPLQATDYCVEDGRLCWVKSTEHGEVNVPLCNFNAKITDVITRDNGLEETKALMILGAECNGRPLPLVEVSTNGFESLAWVTAEWDTRAIISSTQTAKSRLREAILLASQEAKRRTIYSHTGWREIDGSWAYFTAAGALGMDNVDIEVDEDLKNYSLPDPVDDPTDALRASFDFLNIGSKDVLLPLFAAMYLAPLSDILDPAFTLFIVGHSGSYKSTVSALALNHFGERFDEFHLPAAWRDTENKLEKLLFLAKDLPLIIDDWAPGQDTAKARELEVKAEHVIRAQGNRQGKGRLRSDTSSRKSYIPRGLLITSGEQLPGGHSHTARIFSTEISAADIDLKKLSLAQEKKHLYSQAMTQYILWLQKRWPTLRRELPGRWRRWRDQARNDKQHPRLPGVVAWLYAGLTLAMDFLVDEGVINVDEAGKTAEDGRKILLELSGMQSQRVEDERPGKRFLEALGTLLDQGKAVLWSKDDDEPRKAGPGETPIGWTDGEQHILLNPPAAYAAVRQFCQHTDAPFTFKQHAVWRDLNQLGYSDCFKDRNKVNIRIYGQTKWLVKLKKSALSGNGYSQEALEL